VHKMRSRNNMELEIEAITVTWCACPHCAAMGPRFITLVRNDREVITRLRSECCGDTKTESCDGESDDERADRSHL
jgi:hypothetical protein